MRFDLSGCGAGLDESAKDLLELGPLAESLGYDGLWINEEHFGQGSRVCLPPILLATYREQSAAWVGKWGLPLFRGSQQSVGSLRRCVYAFRDAGDDVSPVPVSCFVVVGESDEAAWRARSAGEKVTAGYHRGGE